MAINFDSETETNITRAGNLTNASAVGWATAVGRVLAAIKAQLGGAALREVIGGVSGTGKVPGLDAANRLEASRLPLQIPAAQIQTGSAAGQIPVIGSSGRLPASLTAGGLGNAGNPEVFTIAGDHTWTPPAGLQGVFVIVVGGGGSGGGGALWRRPGDQPPAGFAGKAGQFQMITLPALIVGSDDVAIEVGAGGTPITAAAAVAGGQSSFGDIVIADGGFAGVTGGGQNIPDRVAGYTPPGPTSSPQGGYGAGGAGGAGGTSASRLGQNGSHGNSGLVVVWPIT